MASPARSAMLSDKTNSLPKTGNHAAQEWLRHPENVMATNKPGLAAAEDFIFSVGAMIITDVPFKICAE